MKFEPPFAPRPPPGHASAEEKAAHKERYALRFLATPCALCGHHERSVYHYVTDCPHAEVVAFRAKLFPAVQQHAGDILAGASAALVRAHGPAVALSPAELAAVATLAASPLDPASPSCRFLTYWLLMGVPWPRRVAAAEVNGGVQLPLLSAMGAVFDAMNIAPNTLRAWARGWLAWSEQHIRELAAIVTQGGVDAGESVSDSGSGWYTCESDEVCGVVG